MTSKRNNRVQIPLRIERSLKNRFERAARKDGRSMNRQAEKLIQDYVKEGA